jgi:hypothetical protein
MELTDDDIMDFGKAHRGKRLADVPADYYFWMWEHPKGPQVYKYPPDKYHRYIVRNWRRICNNASDYDPKNHPPRPTRTATHPPTQ